MKSYLDLLRRVKNEGFLKTNRTGIDTISMFGPQIEIDLYDGFPLLTTKKVHTKSIIHELLWFLSGSTNIEYLKNNGVRIWDEWADSSGDLGPVYGKQWRSWEAVGGKIDQINNVVHTLRTDPNCRRIIVSAWNVAEIHEMALPPCHLLFQFYVEGDGRLSIKVYMRSADIFLGVPFNIASYAFLLHMVASVVDMPVGKLIMSFGDVHIYVNHTEQVEEQLSREYRPLPILLLNRRNNDESLKEIDEFKYSDFKIVNYDPHPAIKAEVAV